MTIYRNCGDYSTLLQRYKAKRIGITTTYVADAKMWGKLVIPAQQVWIHGWPDLVAGDQLVNLTTQDRWTVRVVYHRDNELFVELQIYVPGTM